MGHKHPFIPALVSVGTCHTLGNYTNLLGYHWKPSKSVNPFPNKPWFLHVCNSDSFENTVGNGEIAHDKQFLHFPQCFLMVWKNFRHFHHV